MSTPGIFYIHAVSVFYRHAKHYLTDMQNSILMTEIYIIGMTVRGGEGSSMVSASGNGNVQQFRYFPINS